MINTLSLLFVLGSSLWTLSACRSTQHSSLHDDATDPRPIFNVSAELFQNSSLPFLTHISADPMQNYLAMNIQYAPVEALREELQKQLPYKLKNRGEAHITVINPIEYKTNLMSAISMDTIHQIAQAHAIQSSSFQALCLGHGSKVLDGVLEHAWFIVLRSPQLLTLRQEIQDAFLTAGGEKGRFDSQLYYPHITLGFTKRDLHLEDGVVKDESSCVYDLM